MKAISSGSRYEIYDDTLKAYDGLPAQTYTVCFSQMTGFFLKVRPDLVVKEPVYGVHPEKAEKVLRSFKVFQRNLGVILSGDKGIGKSLFARLLSAKAVEAGYPVIIVDQAFPGIASYIESIEQEVVFLFDEFDKTFGSNHDSDPQSTFLSLFDGTSQGKKLFIITCNSLHGLNDYMVNRPGRFHYHFRFGYPTGEEIRQYLTDKLDGQYQNEIEKVIRFSNKVSLNYDCLRSIAFELRSGESFEAAIQDLNIINTHDEQYNLTLYLKDGGIVSAENQRLDLFSRDTKCVYMRDMKGRYAVEVEFDISESIYDPSRNSTVLPGEAIIVHDDPEDNAEKQDYVPDYMTITRAVGRNIHYLTA